MRSYAVASPLPMHLTVQKLESTARRRPTTARRRRLLQVWLLLRMHTWLPCCANDLHASISMTIHSTCLPLSCTRAKRISLIEIDVDWLLECNAVHTSALSLDRCRLRRRRLSFSDVFGRTIVHLPLCLRSTCIRLRQHGKRIAATTLITAVLPL